MLFPREHIKQVQKILAILLLSIFTFANYGINYTDLHHHHEEELEYKYDHHKGAFQAKEDCIICNFHFLQYTPLLAEYINIKNHTEHKFIPVPEYYCSNYFSEFQFLIQQRGPPIS